MDIQKIASDYLYPYNKVAIEKLLQGNFINEWDHLALIGLGGTISSGYSPSLETIIPLPSSPAQVVIDEIQRFHINQQKVTAIDLFAKDSRDINNEDIYLLLDFIRTINNKTILITCGTYMLPQIARAIHLCASNETRIIGLTGSMLPAGFTASDANANVLSALSIINLHRAKDNYGVVFASFHGLYTEGQGLLDLDLHPKSSEDLIFVYPKTNIPLMTASAAPTQESKPKNVPTR